MRERLPNKRKCVTQKLKVNGTSVHFSVGLYPDGRPGELFIDMHKNGTWLRAWCGSTAKLISLMLQFGVPLSELVEALVGECTESTPLVPVVGYELVTEATGVLDAVLRVMAQDYLAYEKPERAPDFMVEFLKLTDDMESAEIVELAEAAGVEDELANFLSKFA